MVTLVETSAWVEYDRATGSTVHLRVKQLIADKGSIGVTEPVIMEVAIGARSARRERELRRLLGRFALLPFELADFDGAVRIYRACRKSGVTPRGLLDCVIASVALRHDASLLAQDGDYAAIAGVMPLRLDDATPR